MLRYYFLFIIVVIIIINFGCKDEITQPVNDSKWVNFESYKFPQDLPEPPEHFDTTIIIEPPKWIGDTQWTCTERIYDLAFATKDYPLFDPNAEVIWPGSLLQGKSVTSPTPDKIPVSRGPGTILIDLLNGSKGVYKTVDEVTVSKVYEAANNIIKQNEGKIPARFYFSAERVMAKNELAVHMHANASFLGIGVSAALNFDENDSYNRFLVQLQQSFYTLIFERPPKISQFFGSDVDTSDLAQYIGPGNPPLYISSVTYGRIFYLLIESTDESSVIEASIYAGFLGIGGGGSTKQIKDLRNLKIKCFAIGGSAEGAINAIKQDTAAIRRFLDEGKLIKVGKPLSYTVRSLATDKLVKNGIATQYSLKNCLITGRQLEREVKIASLGPYYPNHTRGDKEFNGKGVDPYVQATAKLGISSNKRNVTLNLWIKLQEMKPDYTTAEGIENTVVYKAPEGWEITKITTKSYLSFKYEDDDYLYDYSDMKEYMGYFKIIGDTKGNDVGNTTMDDSHWYFMNLRFKVIIVSNLGI